MDLMFFTDFEASFTAFAVAYVNPLSDDPITSITFTILMFLNSSGLYLDLRLLP
jgi:hypothetical protein